MPVVECMETGVFAQNSTVIVLRPGLGSSLTTVAHENPGSLELQDSCLVMLGRQGILVGGNVCSSGRSCQEATVQPNTHDEITNAA